MINCTTFETYRMVVAAFSVTDQANKVRLFKKTFLMINVSQNVISEMSFFIKKKEFAATALDPGLETFVVYVASLKSSSQEYDIYPFCKVHIAALVANEAFIFIPTKYFDFADFFSPELASELFKHTKINFYAIKLVDN